MGTFDGIQPTFAGGEISPLMYSRVDLAKYSTALRTLRNWFVHPQGGTSNRSGFRYVAAAKFADKKCRLIEFEFSDQNYMLEFGEGYIRFYKDRGQIQSGGSPYEIVTPYIEEDLPSIKFAQSGNTIYLVHPSYPPKTLVRASDTSWTLSDFAFVNGPYQISNTNISSTMGITGAADAYATISSSASVFTSDHVNSWMSVDAEYAAQSISQVIAAALDNTNEVFGYRQWKVTTNGTWDGTVSVQVYVGGSWVTISNMTSSNNSNYNTSGDIPYDYPVKVRLHVALNGGSAPVTLTLNCDKFTFRYNVKIVSYVSASTVRGIVPEHGGTSTGAGNPYIESVSTADWAMGSWSTVAGWPSVVCFYQDRLVFASSETEPAAVWLSKSGNYIDFGVSDPLVDSDGISVNIPSRKLNSVQNLFVLSKLIALTTSGGASIGPGSSGVLSPTSISIEEQEYRGSSSAEPVMVGSQAIYVQSRGASARSIGYQFGSDSFTGDDITLMAGHLFKKYTITDTAFCQSPDSLVFATRSDGTLLVLTYIPEQQVLAWTHWDTDGEFESCASIPASNYDELWVVVNRDNGRFIECLADRLPTTETEDQFHVDCGIDYDGTETSSISGLDHLEGQSVIALADGFVQGPFTVVSGTITLTVAASKVHIGLPYTCDVETLNVEVPSRGGTSQGNKQRVSQVTIRFVDSLGGYIGPDSTHLKPITQRTTEPLDTPVPLISGDYLQPIMSSWQSNGRVFFRQTDPLPVTITGIFPKIELGDL